MRGKIFYIANLGSEMTRVLSFAEKGNKEATRSSVLRCLKIIDDFFLVENNPSGRQEVLILKDILNDMLLNNFENYPISKKDLEIYFNPFALRTLVP